MSIHTAKHYTEKMSIKKQLSQACPGTQNLSHNIQTPLTLTQYAKLVRTSVVGTQPLLFWEGLVAH